MKKLIGFAQQLAQSLGFCSSCNRPIAMGARKGTSSNCGGGCCDGSCAM